MKRGPEFTPPENPAPAKCYRTFPPINMPVAQPPGNLRGRGRGSHGGGGRRGFSSATGEHNVSSDDYTSCGLCDTVVGEDGVGCDRCEVWYHPTTQCTGLRDQAIQCIASDGGQGIAFVCSSCRFSLPYSPDNLSRHNKPVSQDSVNQLFEMVKAITITVGSLAETVKIQGEKCNGAHNCNLDDDVLYTKFYEFEDRKKRKDSIIVKGIQAADNLQFSSTFKLVSEKIIGEKLTPENIHCIDQNKSIFRADIPNRELRIRVLQGAKKLKDDAQYKNVYINKDLTFQQRKEARERREEARKRRLPLEHASQGNLTGANQAPLGNRPLIPQGDGASGSSNSNFSLPQVQTAATSTSRAEMSSASRSSNRTRTQSASHASSGPPSGGGF